MKRVLFMLVSVLLFSCAVSYAQSTDKEVKKAIKAAQQVVKDAKGQLSSETGNINQARKLIEQALNNEYTKNDAETWGVAGEVYMKLYKEENNKTYFEGREYDTVAMYNNLVKMFECFNRCDSLEQIPNDKGRTSTACRDKFASELDGNRTNLINGGIFYFNRRHDYAKAYEIFSKYYEVADMPMFQRFNEENENYAKYAVEFAYFPTLAAYQMGDYKKVLKYCDLGVEDEENGKACYQFKCMAYENLQDTANWIKSLKEGIEKFPTEDYYYLRLLTYYDQSEKMDEMEGFVDEMLEKNPDKAYNHYVKGYLKQNQKKYEEAIDAYEAARAKDSTLVEAYINEGLCYMFEANNYMDSQSNVKYNSPAYKQVLETEKSYYQKALPLYEKVRELAPDDTKKWGQQLYSIYYKLNMAKELNKIETILKAEGLFE